MKFFIFLTQEGLTRTPNNGDIENLQVLGISEGETIQKAFNNFVKENEFLLHTGFDNIVAMELVSEKQNYFSLKNHD